jgi:hypothetical protein
MSDDRRFDFTVFIHEISRRLVCVIDGDAENLKDPGYGGFSTANPPGETHSKHELISMFGKRKNPRRA